MIHVAGEPQDVITQLPTPVEAHGAEGDAIQADGPLGTGVEGPGSETVVNLPRWQAALVALGVLILFYGIGLGSMYALGSLLHLVDPSRHFDVLYIFHNEIALLVLVGISVLWLLPPYPPAIQEARTRTVDRVQAANGDGDDDQSHVATLEHLQ